MRILHRKVDFQKEQIYCTVKSENFIGDLHLSNFILCLISKHVGFFPASLILTHCIYNDRRRAKPSSMMSHAQKIAGYAPKYKSHVWVALHFQNKFFSLKKKNKKQTNKKKRSQKNKKKKQPPPPPPHILLVTLTLFLQ